MNPFIRHPHEQGINYLEHMSFAMGIASRLFHSVIAFAIHAIFPFIDIRQSLDLEATARFIQGRNDWIEGAKKTGEVSSTGLAGDTNHTLAA